MPSFKVLCVVMVLAGVVCAQYGDFGGGHEQQEYHHKEEYADHHPKYHFEYSVNDDHTHDIKKHSEHRDGDKVEGEYSLLEADGTTRTVKYYVHGKSGFHATVTKSGHATHPLPVHHQPEYHHQ